MSLQELNDELQAILAGQSSATGVAGAVVGVAVGGEQIQLAHGVANLNTGEPFRTDTRWLIGSVTKTLTATLLLRHVADGTVDLDQPAKKYVPEFALRDSDAADAITVRMLLNHTNGMDADTLMPVGVRGRHAHRQYTESLVERACLFEPGSWLHYSNPGFVLAARIVEEQTGYAFEDAIDRYLFGPCGMTSATAIQTQALLHRTAIGAFADADRQLRASRLFSLPESAAGAGATPIATVADMLAFGRMHLRAGCGPAGERVLPAILTEAMRSPTFDANFPQAPPIGMGWWLVPLAGTTAAWHGGGSPGGTSSLCLLPDYDAVIVSFISGPAVTLHDALTIATVEHLTGRTVEPPLQFTDADIPADISGTYVNFQIKNRVAIDEGRLHVTTRFLPCDQDHHTVMQDYGLSDSEQTYRSVAPDQFAIVGADASTHRGLWGPRTLLGYVPAGPGRPAGLQQGTRFMPLVDNPLEEETP